MQIQKITDKYSVSEQIEAADIDELISEKVEIIICNRPDNESSQQTTFDEIKDAAEAKGIKAVNIAFSAGTLTKSQILELGDLLKTGKKIHAYCRTGNRSTIIWQEALKLDIDKKKLEGLQKTKSPDKLLQKENEKKHTTSVAKPIYDVVIVGAGSGGISAAASLLKRRTPLRIALIDPATDHYYQPGWTMVGGGVFEAVSTKRQMKNLIPRNTTWIQQAVTAFDAENNKVILDDQQEVFYKQLIVAPGLKINWDSIEGLQDTLGKNGVTSNYRFDLAPYTWKLVNELKKGKAIFTQPPMPIKCAGAPQKAMYLSADYWFKNNRIKDIDINFYNAGGVLFGVNDYVPALESYVKKYDSKLHFSHTLTKIDGPNKKAFFSFNDEKGNDVTVESDFDMIHVCPPQCAPDFVAQSSLSDAAGWLDVDQETLQSKRYKNVWGLGDVMNAPNAKTMAAVRKQVPVVAQNIIDAFDGRSPTVIYDGYGSCPLTVERGKIVLAEFGYGGKLLPTFPKWLNDGTKPTKLAWFLKASVLPWVYWKGMLKGHEWLVAPQKK
ncbi:MAG: bifunctional protein tyrosine phosphatase family protein/NAD(P)/FAD-dependent oxidoreductase [Cellvibrionaceae bacterium]